MGFPYFNLEWPGEGLIIVIGWPGQWAAQFMRDAGEGLRVRGGQELTRFKLHPGEEARSPLIANKVALLTREYPPEVYGGAGVHVEFFVRIDVTRVGQHSPGLDLDHDHPALHPRSRSHRPWADAARQLRRKRATRPGR